MFDLGDKLWCYTARNGKFHIWEGVVAKDSRAYWSRPHVKFKGSKWDFVPRDEDIGRIVTRGPKLWLTKRDDNLARKLFIEYEEAKLEEMKQSIEKKRELIRMLKEGLE